MAADDPFPPYIPHPSEWRWKWTRQARERLYMTDSDTPDLERERAAGWVVGEKEAAHGVVRG